MINLLSRLFTPKQAATVPSMDGVLRPNEALDALSVIIEITAPDNFVNMGSDLIFSSGKELFSISNATADSAPKPYKKFESEVTALAASANGILAIGLQDGGIQFMGGGVDGVSLQDLDGRTANCITALAFNGEGELFICQGSRKNNATEWQRDLLEKQASGSVWRVDIESMKLNLIADNLAFPNGVFIQDNSIVISESWKHRLVRFDLNGNKAAQNVIMADMPGYPGRLVPAANGGAWLCVFAPRRQLTEFVLREDAYRTRMLNELSSEHWIAPTLRAGKSFAEPMQGGAVKVHGIHKAWAPTRSYGMLILLDENLTPAISYHSRADGKRHGIVSVCEINGQLLIASRGNDVICTLPISQPELEADT
ncbi:MAG: hypothetical protein COC24_016845 [Alphaproteobacteria bacterium]|nr:hypothetical protein [Alphaproteobacteria bacterium]